MSILFIPQPEYQIDVDLYDLWVVVQEAEQEYGIRPVHSVVKIAMMRLF